MLTPDVSLSIGVLAQLSPAEGKLGMAFLWRRWVFRQELYYMWVVIVASDAAFADNVHDARQDISGAATEAPTAGRTTCLLFLT